MAFSFMRLNENATGHAIVSDARKELSTLRTSRKGHSVNASWIEIH